MGSLNNQQQNRAALSLRHTTNHTQRDGKTKVHLDLRHDGQVKRVEPSVWVVTSFDLLEHARVKNSLLKHEAFFSGLSRELVLISVEGGHPWATHKLICWQLKKKFPSLPTNLFFPPSAYSFTPSLYNTRSPLISAIYLSLCFNQIIITL